MGKIVLVTGATRSGKSSFAEQYAARYGGKIAYIATAQVYDKEMACRVALHKQRRPNCWQTYEAPYKAEQAIAEAVASGHDMILFDCLTLYLSNLLCQQNEATADFAGQHDHILDRISALLQPIKQSEATIVFVTNEVGAGIVPENALARAYRDLAGLTNQLVAQQAAEVYLVACGIPVDIKKLAERLEE